MILILPFEIRPYLPSDRSHLIATINAICAEGEWTYTDQFQPTAAWHHAFVEPGCAWDWCFGPLSGSRAWYKIASTSAGMGECTALY